VVIPKATKALFPDAPKIVKPAPQGHSVLAAGVMQASIEAINAHNAHIDNNLKLLQDEQEEALERQNTANYEAWKDCQEPPPEPEKRKKRFGIF